jgi:hypothetical protein
VLVGSLAGGHAWRALIREGVIHVSRSWILWDWIGRVESLDSRTREWQVVTSASHFRPWS